MPKYKGTGVITETDYKAVKWVGMTKGKKAITVDFPIALNMGNIDWAFAEKDDTVAEVVMTAMYDNTDANATDTAEPYTIEIDDGVTAGASEIMLGAGIFSIGGTAIALTRGGGKLTVEREFRQINADGDRGPVKGRVVLDGSTATLTMNTLQILTKFTDLYPAMAVVTETTGN